MTEEKWLAHSDPRPMLEFLRGKASDRKLRLFACACCRRIWHLLSDERSREAVEAVERFVDARTNDDRRRLRIARRAATDAELTMGRDFASSAARAAAARLSDYAALTASLRALRAVGPWESEMSREGAAQVLLLRDIVGNPFRRSPPFLAPAVLAWNDGTVCRIAQGIYEGRTFDRLPILHDALLDAGCDDEDILAHCRSAGPHVRGCWVIDLILGKQ